VIIHTAAQGTDAWRNVRCAIPTASKFHVLMTAEARKGKLTAGARSYMLDLLAEWAIGAPLDNTPSGGFIGRGTELEDEAKRHYEFTREADIEPVGFITTDDGNVGCSPDGLISSDGLIEVKCYSLQNHISALLQSDTEHIAQVQGCLWVSGRQWCDRVYWNPLLKPVVVRFERDEEYIADLDGAVHAFLAHIEAAKFRLLDLGCQPAIARGPETPLPAPQTVADALGHPPEPPEPSSSEMAMKMADRYLALSDDQREQIKMEFMLSEGHLEQSIESLPVKMLADLNAAILLNESGI
jgi:hypothetical protein